MSTETVPPPSGPKRTTRWALLLRDAGLNRPMAHWTQDLHWRAAYVLIAIGVPLLGWVTWDSGPVVGLLLLAAGASILRWPVVYLWRWLRRQVR